MNRARRRIPLTRRDFHLSAEKPLDAGVMEGPAADTRTWFDIHDGIEFDVLLSGRMRRHWGPVQRDLVPGDICLCGQFEPHGFRFLRGPWSFVYVHLWPGVLQNAPGLGVPCVDWLAPFRVPPGDRSIVPAARRDETLALGRRMRQALQSGDSAGRPRVVLMMMDALLTFMKAEPAAESPRATEVGTSLVLEAAQRVMQSHRMITTSDMAADLGLSVDQFGRRFAREMGSTFAKFGLRSRLHGVAYDLSHGDLPIKAIAADWGFADESHLHRVFLRHFACTPGAYRRQHCGGRGAPALNSS